MLYPTVYTGEEQHLPKGMNVVPAYLPAEEQQEQATLNRLAGGIATLTPRKTSWYYDYLREEQQEHTRNTDWECCSGWFTCTKTRTARACYPRWSAWRKISINLRKTSWFMIYPKEQQEVLVLGRGCSGWFTRTKIRSERVCYPRWSTWKEQQENSVLSENAILDDLPAEEQQEHIFRRVTCRKNGNYLKEEQPESVVLDNFISHVFRVVLESEPRQEIP